MILMLCWARSGGTLLNRMLGVHPSLCVFSEITLEGGSSRVFPGREFYKRFVWQAKFWHGLISLREYVALSCRSYEYQRSIIEQLIRDSGRTMVIREWMFGDYEYAPDGGHDRYRPLIAAPADRCFLLVRDPLDCLSSLLRGQPHTSNDARKRGKLIARWTRNWCRSHTDALSLTDGVFFRFEDMVRDPAHFWVSLCSELAIEHRPECLERFGEYTTYFGDDRCGETRFVDKPRSRGRDELRTEEIRIIEEQAAELMGRFGYAIDGAPAAATGE